MMKTFALSMMVLAILTGCSSSGQTYALGESSGSSNSSSSTTTATDTTGSTASSSSGSDSGSTQETRTYSVTGYGITTQAGLEKTNTYTITTTKRSEIDMINIKDGSNGKSIQLPLIKDVPKGSSAYADSFTVYQGVESVNPYSVVFVGEKTKSTEMPTTGTAHYFGTSHAFIKQSDGSVTEDTGLTSLNVDFANKTVNGKVHVDREWNPLNPFTENIYLNTGLDVNAVIRGSAIQSVPSAQTSVEGQFYRKESDREQVAGSLMGVFSNTEQGISGAFTTEQVK